MKLVSVIHCIEYEYWIIFHHKITAQMSKRESTIFSSERERHLMSSRQQHLHPARDNRLNLTLFWAEAAQIAGSIKQEYTAQVGGAAVCCLAVGLVVWALLLVTCH